MMKKLGLDKLQQDPYPTAGLNAPDEVREVVEELKDTDQGLIPLLYRLLGSGTPDYKMSKGQSLYVHDSEVSGQTCENCQYAYQSVTRGTYICSQIRGNIHPEAWCKLWEGQDAV